MIADEQYIEHEVKMRVLKESTDGNFVSTHKLFEEKLNSLEKRFNEKFNLMIGVAVTAILIPIVKQLIAGV